MQKIDMKKVVDHSGETVEYGIAPGGVYIYGCLGDEKGALYLVAPVYVPGRDERPSSWTAGSVCACLPNPAMKGDRELHELTLQEIEAMTPEEATEINDLVLLVLQDIERRKQ